MGPDELVEVRARAKRQGLPVDRLSDDQVRGVIEQRQADFRDKAPLSAAGAATIILDGVREGRWRILVGEDAKWIDGAVRQSPETAYDADFFSGFGRQR
jgi:hypothetical protein